MFSCGRHLLYSGFLGLYQGVSICRSGQIHKIPSILKSIEVINLKTGIKDVYMTIRQKYPKILLHKCDVHNKVCSLYETLSVRKLTINIRDTYTSTSKYSKRFAFYIPLLRPIPIFFISNILLVLDFILLCSISTPAILHLFCYYLSTTRLSGSLHSHYFEIPGKTFF